MAGDCAPEISETNGSGNGKVEKETWALDQAAAVGVGVVTVRYALLHVSLVLVQELRAGEMNTWYLPYLGMWEVDYVLYEVPAEPNRRGGRLGREWC